MIICNQLSVSPLKLRRAFGGSWVPHLLIGGAAKIATALFYCRFVTLTPAQYALVPAADARTRGGRPARFTLRPSPRPRRQSEWEATGINNSKSF
jgi:hypothetical protein